MSMSASGEARMSDEKLRDPKWKWRFNALTGVMYGPIPVGIIVIIILVIVYLAF